MLSENTTLISSKSQGSSIHLEMNTVGGRKDAAVGVALSRTPGRSHAPGANTPVPGKPFKPPCFQTPPSVLVTLRKVFGR